MYLSVEQHGDASSNSSNIMEVFSILSEQTGIIAALIGTVLGFALSFVSSRIQRRADWERTRKLKQHEAIRDFVKADREEFSNLRRAYDKVLKGRSIPSLWSDDVKELINIKRNYLFSLDMLCVTYMPIMGNAKSETSLKYISDLIQTQKAELADIYNQEKEEILHNGGYTTERVKSLAVFSRGIHSVTAAKNKFIRQSAAEIGAVFK